VNDEKDTGSSGSRWEQADAASGTSAAGASGAPETPPPAGWALTEAPTAELPHAAQGLSADVPFVAQGAYPAGGAYPAAPPRRSRLRKRAAVAGSGAALLVAGGVGGFALGHEAAGNGVPETSVVQDGDTGHGGDGFPGRPRFGDRGTPPDLDGDGTPGGPGAAHGHAGDGTAGDGPT
jgi:hypothetical protein